MAGVQIELAVANDQVGLAVSGLGDLGEMFVGADERDVLHPAGGAPDRDRSLIMIPGQHAVVEGLGGHGAELPAGLLVELVGGGDLGERADCGLGAEPEVLQVLIEELLDRGLAETTVLSRHA